MMGTEITTWDELVEACERKALLKFKRIPFLNIPAEQSVEKGLDNYFVTRVYDLHGRYMHTPYGPVIPHNGLFWHNSKTCSIHEVEPHGTAIATRIAELEADCARKDEMLRAWRNGVAAKLERYKVCHAQGWKKLAIPHLEQLLARIDAEIGGDDDS
jgi:hypothetical protein